MRRAGITIALVLLVTAAPGCGADGAPKRSAYADALGTLCSDQLSSLEAIGNPTTPAELLKLLPKQLVAMKRLATAAKSLQPSAGEVAAKKDFDRFYAMYVDGQVYALSVLERRDYDTYFHVVESALMRQSAAEQAAVKVGADECAKHPFADS
jgi:hypothetical protein